MMNATVVAREQITPELFIIRVKPDGGVPTFSPGQYVAVGLPGSAERVTGSLPEKEPAAPEKLIKRAYSIGSPPSINEYLELYVATVPEGALTPRLAHIKIGERIHVAPKITGTFTINSVPTNHNLILVSTGTGVAPYLAMVRHKDTWTTERTVTIVHGVRHSPDLAYREELEELAKSRTDFSYIPIVSRTDPEWNGATGRVQTLFEKEIIALDSAKDHVFLCGNPAMIDDMEKLLLSKGYSVHSKKNPDGKLHLEKYW